MNLEVIEYDLVKVSANITTMGAIDGEGKLHIYVVPTSE